MSIFALAAAMGLGAGAAYAQGPYYQPTYVKGGSNNPGGTGATAVGSSLNYIDSLLPSGTTLYYPVPAGFTAATAAQINAAVQTAASNAAAGTAPAGVTLQNIATQIVNNQAANATGALTALANGVISQSTANAGSNLAGVMSALATAYPTNLSTYTAGIFTSAASNSTVANSMQTILAGATNTAGLSDQTVGTLAAQALNATATSSLGSSQIQSVVQNIVSGEISSAQVGGSAAAIQAVLVSATTGTVTAQVPLANILNTAVSSLSSKSNANVGAIAVGALVSSPSNASTIASTLASASSGTATYTNYIIGGFNTGGSASSYANFLAANPAGTDAIVAGATALGALSPANIIQSALTSGSTVSVQSIVSSAVSADLARGASNAATIAGAAVLVNPSTANYLQISQGAVGAARPSDAGAIVYTEISDSPGYVPPPQGAGSLSATNVNNIVTGAVNGAYTSGKTSGLSGIVYNAESAAYSTSATLTTPVSAAVSAILANDTSADKPTYIAVSAALAGYGGTVTASDPNLQAIVNAADALDSRSVAQNAFTAAQNVVNSIRLTNATAYITTFNSFTSNASATDSYQAVLYAASLADSSDTSALLAAALAKAAGGTAGATLLADAVNANPSKQAALNIAYTVANHIAASNGDLTSFVGYQVQQNIANVADVTAAAVAVDPNQAHFIARAVAYSDPQTAYSAVKSLFAYAQITTHGQNSSPSTPIDETSAAAAISAGFTIGIIEASTSPSMQAAGAVQNALSNGIQAAVLAAVSQSGVALQGATLASSLGTNTTTSTNKKSVGAAGVITGFMAQTLSPGDTAIGQSSATLLSQAVIDAALKAAVQNGGATYALQMAQAAGQAFGYVSGYTGPGAVTANLNSTQITSIATEIGNDLYTAGGVALQNLINAAIFGLNQGQKGIAGAGATGINNYGQHSATGTPVTDIFNL